MLFGLTRFGIHAGKYTIIAHVIDGMDVLDKMEKNKVGMCRHFCISSGQDFVPSLHIGLCEKCAAAAIYYIHCKQPQLWWQLVHKTWDLTVRLLLDMQK